MARSKIPVTLLTGFLGAGKTTLLKYILNGDHGKRILVIQNEFADEMGIESPLLLDKAGNAIPDVFELPNGCLCCSVRDSLIGTLEAVLKARPSEFDYVIVEASGVADPEKVIGTFWVDAELESEIFLDGVVTLVDAKNILRYVSLTPQQAEGILNGADNYSNEDEIRANLKSLASTHHKESDATGERPFSTLSYQAMKQISCGSVLLVNKCDLVDHDPKHLDRVDMVLRHLNPTATILRCQEAHVPLSAILGIHDFVQPVPLSFAVHPSLPNDSLHEQHHTMPVSHCMITVRTMTLPLQEVHCDSTSTVTWTLPLESSRLWSVHDLMTVLGSIVWDNTCGKIYRYARRERDPDALSRYKGLCLCHTDADAIELHALQGVGELFSLEPVTTTATLLSNLIKAKLYDAQEDSTTSTFYNKFLFVGEDLHPVDIQHRLEAAVLT